MTLREHNRSGLEDVGVVENLGKVLHEGVRVVFS